jgi:hypothetical protein
VQQGGRNYPDVDLYSCNGNVFMGNTHGAPNARTNTARLYVEDGSSADNLISSNAVEINSAIAPNGHYYNPGMFTVQSSTRVKDNRPDTNWPQTSLLAKSANYAISKFDLFEKRTIHATGTVTLTLPSAGSVHSGDQIVLKNTGTGIVTVATTSSQTIDGATSHTLTPDRAVTLQSDGTGWQILTSRGQAPSVLPTPLALLQTVSATAWPAANTAVFQRFTVDSAGTFRYLNWRLDAASGNVQVGVVRLSGTGLTTYARVMDSGVIAAPIAGDQHTDLGATKLPAGDYAAFVWMDNATATARVASNSGISSMRLAAEAASLTSGVPASGTLTWTSSRFIGGLTIEQDV